MSQSDPVTDSVPVGDLGYADASDELDAIIAELDRQTRALALALKVGGLMNVQYAIKDDEIYVIEVNPRASRTVPFVSKAQGQPFANLHFTTQIGRWHDEKSVGCGRNRNMCFIFGARPAISRARLRRCALGYGHFSNGSSRRAHVCLSPFR